VVRVAAQPAATVAPRLAAALDDRTAAGLASSVVEIAERGQALFEREIGPQLDVSAHGKFVVLDIETGSYEIDADELAALKRARARRPEAPLYLVRVGFPTAYRLGRRAVSDSPCSPGG
jgi:hypothetical protein